MPKKKPEPVTINGLAGQTYTVQVTERGLRIEIDERWRIVYTSVLSGLGYLRFDVEPVDLRTRDLSR